MISVGILGATGYTGKHLYRLCHQHPYVQKVVLYGYSNSSKTLHELFPEMVNRYEDCSILSIESLSYQEDLYFVAVPHGESCLITADLLQKGKYVINLGGDFRIDSPHIYQKWYGCTHPVPELLSQKVYGLADFYSQSYRTKLVANPGCYPTGILLALLPLVQQHADAVISISSVAYSGTSGAGKTVNPECMFTEMYGNVKAYNINAHRHEPEITQQLKKHGYSGPYSFTPHILPITQGIYATNCIHCTRPISQQALYDLYAAVYQHTPFVRIRKTPPQIKWVVQSNFCDISISCSGTKIIITAALDNLVKGASGQAVQNMNKVYSLPVQSGLTDIFTEKKSSQCSDGGLA